MNEENDTVAELAEYIAIQAQRVDDLTEYVYRLQVDGAQSVRHEDCVCHQDQLRDEIRSIVNYELMGTLEQIRQEFTKDIVREIAAEFIQDVRTLCSI